jgi:hypothetical protein
MDGTPWPLLADGCYLASGMRHLVDAGINNDQPSIPATEACPFCHRSLSFFGVRVLCVR